MRANPRFVLGGLTILSLLIGSSAAHAQLIASSLDQILPAVASPSPANIRLAEKAWQGQDPAATDVLTKYAMGLALVANNRHSQAFELIDSIPYSARKAGPIRRAYVWLTVKLKKDDLAVAEIQSLLDELKSRAANVPTGKDLEDVTFAGKLVAYLQHVAEREEPLAPPKAKSWWQLLTSLPADWKVDLPLIEQTMTAHYQQKEKELQAAYVPWRQKTDAELATAQKNVANLALKEAAASADVTTAINNQTAFAKTAKPQVDAIDNESRQLQTQRNTIPQPREPREPKGDKKDGKVDPADKRKYDQEKREYRKEKSEYDDKIRKIEMRLLTLQMQRNTIAQQQAAHLDDVKQKRETHRRAEAPLRLAEKKELALKNQLADRPKWDSPGTLMTLRALDAYVTIDLAKEVARIQAARLR